MKFLKSSLIIFLFCMSCQNNQAPLDGHWHVYSTESFEKFSDEFYHLYIQDTLGKLRYNSIGEELPFHIDKEKQLFTIWREGLYGNSKFKIVDDTLFFELYEKTKAIRVNREECNIEAEFFYGINVNIDLPKNKNAIPKTLPRYLELPLFIGLPKKQFKEYNADTYYYSSGNQFISFSDIDFVLEKHFIKLPERHHSKVYAALYADKNSPDSLLKIMADTLKNRELKVYQAFEVAEEQQDSFYVGFAKF